LGQGGDGLINIDRLDEFEWMGEQITQPQAVTALKALQAAATQLEANVNPRLAMEELSLRLPYLQKG
jgi:hypothetical protein